MTSVGSETSEELKLKSPQEPGGHKARENEPRGSEHVQGFSGSPNNSDMIREIKRNLVKIKLKNRWGDGSLDTVFATRALGPGFRAPEST